MSALGSLVVSLAANTASFTSDLGKASREASKRAEDMKRDFERAGKAIGIAMVAAAGTVAVLVKQAINNADAMTKMAQSAGISVQALSELNYVAKLGGVETQTLATSIARLNRNMVDAAGGTGEAIRGFAALNLELKNADGTMKSADKVMGEVADKFKTFADGPEKAAIAMMLFGKAGAAMIPMLNKGSEEIVNLRKEARAFGVTIETETGQAAERFNDNLNKLVTAGRGLAHTFTAQLLPSLNDVTDAMVRAAKESSELHNMLRDAADLVKTGALVAFQTIAIVGANIAFVFKTIGGELLVWAEQLGAIARLDFKGFKLIGEAWRRDAEQARKDLDAFQARIMALGKPGQEGLDFGIDFGGLAKSMAPVVQSTEQIAKAAAAAKKALQDLEKEKEFIGKQFQEGLEEEQRIQEEAWAAMVEFRDKQLEQAREFQDFKNQILIEAYDREQEEAIARGEQMLEIEKSNAERSIAIERYKNSVQRSMQMTTWSLAGDLLQQFAGKSKAAAIAVIAISKGLAIAQTIQATAVAVMRAFADLGPIAGAPVAAQMKMLGAIQIGLITATGLFQAASVGSGGASPGTPANPIITDTQNTPVASAAPHRITNIINLHGETYSRKQVRDLLEQLNEEEGDGGRFFVT